MKIAKDYKAIFDRIESTLISVGSENRPVDSIRENLEPYKRFEGKVFSDSECFQKLVDVIFYSGFRAATVTAKLELIHKHFPGYQTVAGYGDDKVAEMLSDGGMIRNERKIRACIQNAQIFQAIVKEHGSFRKYVDSFCPADCPTDSFENLVNLILLKEDLEVRFDGLGGITAYHVLTDIGLNVLKPDRVICRLFQRLGLIKGDEDVFNKQPLTTIIEGRKFAAATGHPIRYIDIVFVAYGQVKSIEFGVERGICTDNPSCNVCHATEFCNYYARKTRGEPR